MISKELFKSIIESMRDQQDSDIEIADMLGNVLKSDINPYDNTLLVNSLFKLLEVFYPIKIGVIKDFCYEFDFGRNLESTDAISELYDRLNPMVSTHPLIDDFCFDFSNFDLKPNQQLFETPTTTDINDIEVSYTVVSPLKKIYRIDE